MLAAAALAWAAVVSYTGGLRVEIGTFRISTRNATNPLILAVTGVVMALALAPRHARRDAFAADLAALGITIPAWAQTARAAACLAALAAVGVTTIGLVEHSGAVGASDSYGYLSQAQMFAAGRLHVDEPLIEQFAEYNRRAFAPLGWTPDPLRPEILPTYPPGLSLLMAGFMLVAGAAAAFAVVPLSAGIATWATFILGRALAGPWGGAAAAVLLASSPAFLYQTTTWPMSDVPATAGWAACLALLTGPGWLRALAAGLAAGLAILTRPNLAPLALLPVLWIAWTANDDRRGRRDSLLRLAAYVPGAAAGALAVGAFNAYWFGSPLSSGYGALDALYGWGFWWPNLRNFGLWLAETQTPLLALAIAGPFLVRELEGWSPARRPIAAACAGVVIIALASYVFYYPFEPWWNLRFILPAFPAMLVFLAVTIMALARRAGGNAATLGAVAVVLALSAYGVSKARERSAFEQGAESRFVDAARYVKDQLPDNAVIMAVLHGGSIRLYADRPTIRWDWLSADEVDRLLDELVRRGSAPYLLVDDAESEPFRMRFPGTRAVAALDQEPLATLANDRIRVYPLAPAGRMP